MHIKINDAAIAMVHIAHKYTLCASLGGKVYGTKLNNREYR